MSNKSVLSTEVSELGLSRLLVSKMQFDFDGYSNEGNDSGLYLPDGATLSSRYRKGEVLAVSKDLEDKVSKGDTVYYDFGNIPNAENGGYVIEADGNTGVLIDYRNVVLVECPVMV